MNRTKTNINISTKTTAKTVTKSTTTPSRLSLGPKNPQHRTYRQNEHSLAQALCQKLSERSIDIKAKDIYQNAGVTSPTFYYHYHNSNDARMSYEDELERNFYRRITLTSTNKLYTRHTFYLILTSFIQHYHTYFQAVAQSDDHHLLKKLLCAYRTVLVGSSTSNHNFAAYVAVIIAIINHWLLQDLHTPATTALYAKRLANIRVVKWW